MLADLDRTDPGWRLEEIEANRPTYPAGQNAALCHSEDKGADYPGLESALNHAVLQLLDNLDPPALLNEQQIDALKRIEAESAAASARPKADRHAARPAADRLESRLDFDDSQLSGQPHCRARAQIRCDGFGPTRRCGGALLDSAAFHCGPSIGDEPMSISQLVRIACQAVALNTLEPVLGPTEPSEAALEAFQKRLEEPKRTAAFLLFPRRTGRRVPLDRMVETRQFDGEDQRRRQGQGLRFSVVVSADPGRDRVTDHKLHMRFMTEMIEVARKPPEQWTTEFAALNQQVANLPTLAEGPSFQRWIRSRRPCSEYAISDSIVMLAAERFRKKHDRWPESLDELKKTGLLAEIPIDPYVGGPLKWKRTEDGVIIYAVGPNLFDDGGDLTELRSSRKRFRLPTEGRGQAPEPAPPPKIRRQSMTEPNSPLRSCGSCTTPGIRLCSPAAASRSIDRS